MAYNVTDAALVLETQQLVDALNDRQLTCPHSPHMGSYDTANSWFC